MQYLKAFLAEPPDKIQSLGGLIDNAGHMKAQIADDQARAVDRGRFSILAPQQSSGIYNGVRFGLENESAKLNLQALLAEGVEDQARDRLMKLPSMTPEVADAILDWIDADDMPREFGAEIDYYGNLDPPTRPRNGPIAGLDELLHVRGVTPELLFGLDQNHNFFVDASETARGAMMEVDNAEGLMNRGWAAYLTIDSVELVGGRPPAGLIDLNGPDLKALYDALKVKLTDEQAKFIVLYRQYGTPPQTGDGNRAEAGPDQGGEGQGAEGGERGQRDGAGGAAGPNRPGADGNTVSAGSIEINYQQQGGTQLLSLLDLVGAQLQVPATPPGGQAAGGEGAGGEGNNGGDGAGGDNNAGGGNDNGGGQPGGQGQPDGNQPPPQNVASPWKDAAAGYRDLLKLCDIATPGNPGRVAGRVNINAASRPVLLTIPELPPATVEQILARREANPNPLASDQRHALWLLIEGIVPLDQMRRLERFITARGDAYSGQSVGFFDGDSMPVRLEFILDCSVAAPRLRMLRDLSSAGPGFAPELLGAAPDTK